MREGRRRWLLNVSGGRRRGLLNIREVRRKWLLNVRGLQERVTECKRGQAERIMMGQAKRVTNVRGLGKRITGCKRWQAEWVLNARWGRRRGLLIVRGGKRRCSDHYENKEDSQRLSLKAKIFVSREAASTYEFRLQSSNSREKRCLGETNFLLMEYHENVGDQGP